PELFRRGRHRGDAHERRARDADAGYLRRARPAVPNLPMDEEGLGHDVAQEAEARHYGAEGDGLGDNVGELDLQYVARHRILDIDGAGQRMHGADIERWEVGDGR